MKRLLPLPLTAAVLMIAAAPAAAQLTIEITGAGEKRLPVAIVPLAGEGAHADALLDGEAAGLHDALLQAPALRARVLEVQVGVVDAAPGERAEHGVQAPGGEVVRRQQARVCGGNQVFGVHRALFNPQAGLWAIPQAAGSVS